MKFYSKATIVFDPVAGKAKNMWWAIAKCCPGIVDYYHHWIEKEFGVTINKPLFGSHVSIVRGEEPPHKDAWRKWHDVDVVFSYTNDIQSSGEYWWLPVECEELSRIRNELGLNPIPVHGFHLTIGKTITLVK